MDSIKRLVSVKLAGKENYKVWAYTIQEHLKTAGVFEFVKSAPVKEEKEDVDLAQLAYSILLSSMNESEIEKVIHCSSAYEIWTHLTSTYGAKSSNIKLELMSELNSFTCKEAKEVASAVSNILTIKGKLAAHGVFLDESMVIAAIIRVLPSELYSTFLETWRMFEVDQQTEAKFVSKLLEKTKTLVDLAEKEAAMVAVKTNPTTTQLNDNQKSTSVDVICHYCKKTGHYKSDCLKLKKRQEFLKKQNLNAQVAEEVEAGEVSFVALQMPMSTEAVGEGSQLATTWVADSGCSAHMTPNISWIRGYKTFSVPAQIRIGDNSVIMALGAGKIKTSFGWLLHVYYVPKLGPNLFSLSAASKQGARCVINDMGLHLFRKDELILRSPCNNGTYLISLPVELSQQRAMAATIDVWHQRLSHLPKELVVKMATDEIVTGLNIVNKAKDVCLDCKLNKCQQASHKSRSTSKAIKSGQHLHMDIIGPITPVGLSGKQRYILNIVDEFSSFRIISTLKARSQVPETIKVVINQVATQTGQEVVKITSDQAEEFLSERLASFLQRKGIDHSLSAIYCPQQNGTAERANRTLLTQARTILNSSKLPHELWPEAIATATYVSNRCISRQRRITPFELWFGTKPSLSNIRIFGQQASVLRSNEDLNKFDEKGRLMYFVSYTDNFQTYKFYNPASKQIMVSCDAVFLNSVGAVDDVKAAYKHHVRILDEMFPLLKSVEDPNPLFDFRVDTSADTSKEATGDDSSLVVENQSTGVLRESVSTIANAQNIQSVPSQKESSGGTIDTQEDQEEMQNGSKPDEQWVSSEEEGDSLSVNEEFSSALSTPRKKHDAPIINHATGAEDILEQPSQSNLVTSPASNDDIEAEAQSLRRSKRSKIFSGNYQKLSKNNWDLSNLRANVAQEIRPPPENYEEIHARPDSEAWIQALTSELTAMKDKRVYDLVPRPVGNIVGCKYVFTNKVMPDGSVKPKVRLVAQGYSQRQGVDYYSTFAPVVQIEAVRLLLAIAAERGFQITQCDIKTAFLNGDLDTTIYMKQPPGISDGTDKVWRLRKSIYGLKQAPKCWNKRLIEFLLTTGLRQSTIDNCILYTIEPLLFIAVYVDDLLIISADRCTATTIINKLATEFDIHIIQSGRFIGLQYRQLESGSIFIHQTDYLTEILKRYNMWDVNPVTTPIATGQILFTDDPLEDSGNFQEIVGALNYAVTQTRLDLAFTVGYLSRKVKSPSNMDWKILRRCLRYVRGNLDYGILYLKGNQGDLVTYTDSDFAGDKSYKSTTGMVVLYNNSPIAWKSKLQKTVVTSTTEAEYLALTSAIKSTMCLKSIGQQLKLFEEKSVPVLCDNKGAVLISSNDASVKRTRHMGAQLAYAREKNEEGSVNVQQIGTSSQLADLMTKPLSTEKFTTNRNKLMTSLILSLTMFLHFLVATATKLEDIQTMDKVVFLKTAHYVNDGIRQFRVTVPIIDRCEKLRTDLKQANDQNVTVTLLTASLETCLKIRREIYLQAIEDVRRTKIEASKLYTRLTRSINTIGELPSVADTTAEYVHTIRNDTFEQPSQLTFWSTYLSYLAGGQVVAEYYDKDSAYNKVFQHENDIRLLSQIMNNHTRQMGHITQASNKTISAIRKLLLNQQLDHGRINQLIGILPGYAQEISRLNVDVKRDADLLYDIRAGIQKGIMDTATLVKINPENKELFLVQPEETKLIEVRVAEKRIFFHFSAPRINPNVNIYKITTLKDWIDTSSFQIYQGPEYILYNKTNRCSKFIEKPESLHIQNVCTNGNQSINFINEKYWRYVEISHDNAQEETMPTIIETSEGRIVQCFGHNMLIGGKIYGCLRQPQRISYNTSFNIIGFGELIDHNEVSLDPSNLLTPMISTSGETTEWTERFKSALLDINQAETAAEKAQELQFSARMFEFISENPKLMGGTATFTLIMIILLLVCIIGYCRPDPVVRLAQSQVLMTMAEHANDQQKSERCPTVNINIGNELYPTLSNSELSPIVPQRRISRIAGSLLDTINWTREPVQSRPQVTFAIEEVPDDADEDATTPLNTGRRSSIFSLP